MLHIVRVIIIFIFIQLFTVTLWAQKNYSQNYTINSGLPSNSITAIFKDSRGLLWVATDAGLCSFNGKAFKIYGTTEGLASNNISSVTEDKEGNLWIGCMNGGLSKFDGLHFTKYTTKEGLISNAVRKVWYSKKFDVLFVGTNDGCSVLDGKKFYSYSAKEAKAQFDKLFITGFLEGDDYVNIYAVATNEPIRFYPKTKRYELRNGLYSNKPSSSTAPLVLNNSDTIFGDERKGITVKRGSNSKNYSEIGQVFNLAKDEFNNVWIAGWADENDRKEFFGGLFKFDGKNVERFSEKVGISDRSVWTVYYDTTFHILWVGTLNQGLYKILAPAFTYYDASYFGVPTLSINDLLFNEGSLWIGTKGYLVRLFSDGDFQSFDLNKYSSFNKVEFTKIFQKTESYLLDENGSYLKYQSLIKQGLYNYPNPYLLIMEDLDFSQIKPPRSLYNPVGFKKNLATELAQRSYLSPNVFHLGKDSHGNLYFSDKFGLKKLDKDKGYTEFTAIPIKTSVQDFIFDESDTLYHTGLSYRALYHSAIYPEVKYPNTCRYHIPSIIQMISKNGEVWMASKTEGLFRVYRGQVDAFSSNDTSLPKIINCLSFDRSGNVVVGANNGEILIVKYEKDKLKVLRRITNTEGIIGNVIRWMIVDNQNHLYIGTNLGLNVVDLETMYTKGRVWIKYFNQDQGFNDYSGKVAALDSIGNIWIGTDNQVVKINTAFLSTLSRTKQSPYIHTVDVNNQSFQFRGQNPKNYWVNEIPNNYRYDSDQTSLTFHFSTLNYLVPENTIYRYRLHGLNNSWTQFNADSKAVFTSLKAGKYKLEVEVFNSIDNSRVDKVEVDFSIARAFYKTWWFITLMVLVFLLVIWLLYQSRISEIRKREQQKTELQQEMANIEMRALQAQMKPHFIFNAINSIQSYILDNDVDKALYYLIMFSKLIRKTLENASKEVIPLGEELEYLRFYIELEKMRFDGLFIFEEIIDPEISLNSTLITPMIIQPFIENAIKHGLMNKKENGKLCIEVRQMDQAGYKFIIDDNGVGRKYSQSRKDSMITLHQSKGIQIISDRFSLLNEKHKTNLYSFNIIDMEDENGNSLGTRVEVTFPTIHA